MRNENFCIPAVTCIVRHLCGSVLPESQVLAVDTSLEQEEVHPTHKVTGIHSFQSLDNKKLLTLGFRLQ